MSEEPIARSAALLPTLPGRDCFATDVHELERERVFVHDARDAPEGYYGGVPAEDSRG